MTDWLWPVVLALVIPAALGHLYHFILLVNVISGLGYPRAGDGPRARPALRGTLDLVGALLWMHLRDAMVELALAALRATPSCAWSRALSSGRSLRCSSLRAAARGNRRFVPDDRPGARNGTDALIGAGRHSWLLRLPRNDSFRLCTPRVGTGDPRPARRRSTGLQIVQLSDLHFAPCFERRFFEAVVEPAAAGPPTWSSMTGDIVEHDEAIAWIEPVLEPARGPAG